MRSKLLLASVVLSNLFEVYGSDDVGAQNNEVHTFAGALVTAARLDEATNPTLSFVYREQQAFPINAIQSTFSEQRDWQVIDFGAGGLRNETAKAFGEVLRYQRHLKTLRIVRTQLNFDALEAVVRNIGECPLETLNLDFVPLGAKGAIVLTRYLPNASLVNLHLSGCKIGDFGAKALARVLPGLPNLRYLNIIDNDITDEGAKLLFSALLSSQVQQVELSSNDQISRSVSDRMIAAFKVKGNQFRIQF